MVISWTMNIDGAYIIVSSLYCLFTNSDGWKKDIIWCIIINLQTWYRINFSVASLQNFVRTEDQGRGTKTFYFFPISGTWADSNGKNVSAKIDPRNSFSRGKLSNFSKIITQQYKRQLTIISEDFSALTITHCCHIASLGWCNICGKLSFSSPFSDGMIFCSQNRLLTRENFHLQLKENWWKDVTHITLAYLSVRHCNCNCNFFLKLVNSFYQWTVLPNCYFYNKPKFSSHPWDRKMWQLLRE